MDSVGGMFSLSEFRYSGSLKNLGLYSVSVRLEGHGPESEVMLLLFFLGVNTPGSLLGLDSPSLVGFFHGLNFSVHFSVSSTKVWLPVLVLTFCYVRQCLLVLNIVLDFFICLGFCMHFISLYDALSLHNCLSSGSLVFARLGSIY